MDLLKEFDILKVKEKFREIILRESQHEYFKRLMSDLKDEYENNTIFPKKSDVFNAFKYRDFHEIKCVIIGQDPYYKKNEAHGLSFSICDKDIKIPSSLRNIFKELEYDLGISIPCHGDLSSWCENGVLLLNSVLTVREGFPNSHKDIGWSIFTDSIIKNLCKNRSNLVFILWGNFARKKEKLIDKNRHLIIKSSHPSGLSAHKGFFTSKPFSKTNDYLKDHLVGEIDWKIN
ncbi:uracil-DNA glycosylase [Candidatus Arthromitus sp. SFB-mouse-Japan]|uniref:uracil-DNA glycosylase n=1 Tax=Candidatus Arthromitus sp. SFB-mouse TaxID=49118 RepID=UPI00021B7CDA|nr:uracil-DNA glycosylase [Candidatus Arthromitus sp. SFB-mouse-NYU]EIA22506.1 Putative Uracil-DNA glycosylase superfamily protein [Candidatus Arthromitus sp. SFB-2]EIA22671.1 Putative Uracil-DNA glycosylase superfamily [Candidatus Arthromitus sp. SFB-1]EIA22955.1 Putative uracil-DNA glycosylase [Candidatus Arthromitus sp. SFB-3]EIA26143.1 Putative uracil-DNA glycosylase [Candidatus Arthromitus sp. SFB-4]EIA28380.1 Putative uracil-DNA glycosylase [Candidatus Arthromitus sp. SFB-co]EIA29830.1 